jgi:hypothetical protein
MRRFPWLLMTIALLSATLVGKPRQNRLCWVSHPLTEHRLT